MLEVFGLSDPGCVRKNNEDCFLLDRDAGLYLVADGMGGAQAGEHASRLAVDTVAELVQGALDPPAPELLTHAFEEANRRVLDAAAQDCNLEGMGTTLVGVLDCGDELAIASVGDSRAYLHRNGELRVITEDQTWVQEVGRRLGLEDAMLRAHPMRHVLTMAIGVSNPLRVHSYSLPPEPGTQILLCSDGLHGVVPQEVIAEVMGSERTLQAKCHYLIEAACNNGGPDNITAVLLRIAG
jgi:protein phosphatase